MLVSSGGPVILTGVRKASTFLLLMQASYQLIVVRRHPGPRHFEETFALLMKLGFLHAVRLGAENPTLPPRAIDKYMRCIRMRSQDLVQSTAAAGTGPWKLLAYVVDQFVGPLVNLLFRNGEYLVEVALDRCGHRLIALDVLQVVHAESDQYPHRQNYCELEREDQSSLRIPAGAQFLEIHLINSFFPQSHYLSMSRCV